MRLSSCRRASRSEDATIVAEGGQKAEDRGADADVGKGWKSAIQHKRTLESLQNFGYCMEESKKEKENTEKTLVIVAGRGKSRATRGSRLQSAWRVRGAARRSTVSVFALHASLCLLLSLRHWA